MEKGAYSGREGEILGAEYTSKNHNKSQIIWYYKELPAFKTPSFISEMSKCGINVIGDLFGYPIIVILWTVFGFQNLPLPPRICTLFNNRVDPGREGSILGDTVIYPGGIVQDLPRGRFWGAHYLPRYNLGGGYIFRFYTVMIHEAVITVPFRYTRTNASRC